MRIVDLSLEIADNARYYRGHPKAIVTEYLSHADTKARFEPPCEGYAASQLIMVDHFGTHMDAPYHFFPALMTTESVPLDTLCGPAVLIDCTDRPPGQPVTADALDQATQSSGTEVRRGDIVLVRCFGGEIGQPGWEECRALAASGAQWLLDRGVKTVGVDTGSVDDYTALSRPAHLLLLGNNVILIENLANLGAIGQDRFFFVGLPLKLKGATGSPIRAVALTDLEA